MADAIVSVVAERIVSIIQDQIREEVNLVRGVDKKILNLSKELQTIRRVLDDAEKKGLVGMKSVSDWLRRLEDATYEMDDVLDEWYTALLRFQIEQKQKSNANNAPRVALDPESYKVCNYSSFIWISSCLCFQKVAVRRDISKKIENVKVKIDLILAEKGRYGLDMTTMPHASAKDPSWRVQSTSFIDLEEIHGRDSDRDDLMSRVILTMPPAGGQTNHLDILSVVGVGGVGKTTLAQLVYNDSRVKECFELRIWTCVSDPFDEIGIAKKIIEGVTGRSPDSNQLEILLQCLKECISGMKFLLVMDDVWTEDSTRWEPLITSLKNGGIGSKVLVTTRNERVAKMMGTLEDGIHRLGVISDKTCWLLLRRIALFGRDIVEWKRFEDIGMLIANKCKGLPLAAKALGSLLRFKNHLEEWENVLNSEIWELEEARVDLFPHFLLSYNELSPTLKRCFSYCAVFPKDTRINVEELIGHWMAVGYLGFDGSGGDMELRGRQYFDNLAMRSLFQDFEKNYLDGQIMSCKMHDIVHDFARLLRKNGNSEAGIKKTSSCEACSPLLVSLAKEYRSVYFCIRESHRRLCGCLSNTRVLSLREYGQQRIPHELEMFIHMRWLDLSCNALDVKGLETICKLYNLQTLLLRNCNLKEITREIGNLIHLRHLNLSMNKSLKELPESVCDLHELQRLNIDLCEGICRLPQGFHRLINLKHLHNYYNTSLEHFPQGLAQLTGLCTLTQFHAGRGRSELGWLKNLNRLGGSLQLFVKLFGSGNIVEDAREGEMRKKDHIQELNLTFYDEVIGVEDWEWVGVLDALEPHPNITYLQIFFYGGSKLPSWMASPLNRVKFIRLEGFSQLSSLPPLGRLPCLEEIEIHRMHKMQHVGPEFFRTEGGSSSSVAFPKLKRLTFENCYNLREWEDITAEEDCGIVSVMPCLEELNILQCDSLTILPHRLLRKVASTSSSLMEKLDISFSTQLKNRYGDRQGTAWKSISDVSPRLRLIQD